MKKSTLTIIILCVVIALIALWFVKGYNKLVTAEETVTTEWSNVESQYQRRSDLIPNLVSVVKGYAEHESETFEAVVAARAKATQTVIDPSNITPEDLAKYQEAQGELNKALGRLMMIQENYPDLKANENFRDLQEQLEGTENRIQVSRKKYNEQAKVYNTMVRRFPNNILSGIFGFEQKAYFKADEGAQNAPKIQF